MNQISHWSHEHPLLLREGHKTDNEQLSCGICDRHIENHSNYYTCDSCKFYVHESCAELPRQISPYSHYSFHSSHGPLTLHTHRHFYCHSCHREFRNAPCFECNQCDFYMDVECALMPPTSPWGLKSFTHQHPMLVVEVNEKADDEIKCFGCHSKSSSSDTVFGCTKCKHFLHESCANLPLTIQYPPHRIHGNLTLRVRHEWFTCKLCKKQDNRTLIFDCQQCNFRLCVKCGMTVKGTIRYEFHEHPLWFWDNPEYELAIGSCNGYDAYCKKPFLSNSIELRDIQSIFKCLDCDFKMHLLCGPLPSSIKYEYHIHPLILKDSVMEDDCNEYCCEICESERDPRIRVYHCKECKYVAHVRCVISEVKNALKEVHRDMKHLKSIGEDWWQLPQEIDIAGVAEQLAESSTFKDLLATLKAGELKRFKADFEWDGRISLSSRDHEDNINKGSQEEESRSQSISSADPSPSDLRDEYIDELLRFSRFTEYDFENLSLELAGNFYDRKLKINSSYLALKTVEMEGYKIPFTLARVLKSLFLKHGDITCKYQPSISSTMKSITLSFVCKVVKEMHSISVRDITKDLLEDWYFYVEFASYRAQIDMKFLEEPLRKITRAFFGFQLSKLDTQIPAAISEKIKKLSSQKDVQQDKLEKCRQFHSSKSKFVTECLTEAAKYEWTIASEV